MRAGAPGRRPPSALCSLTEQMHLHGHVQRIFADATCKRSVHEHDDFAREYERPPSAASTPKQQQDHAAAGCTGFVLVRSEDGVIVRGELRALGGDQGA